MSCSFKVVQTKKEVLDFMEDRNVNV